jgi:hypothetical protein
MVRVWADDAAIRQSLREFLGQLPLGRLIDDEEREELGVAFKDRSQGDVCWVADEGVLVVPSYMGRSMLKGMHGYHPDAGDADACVLGLDEPGRPMSHIRHLYDLMRDGLDWVRE